MLRNATLQQQALWSGFQNDVQYRLLHQNDPPPPPLTSAPAPAPLPSPASPPSAPPSPPPKVDDRDDRTDWDWKSIKGSFVAYELLAKIRALGLEHIARKLDDLLLVGRVTHGEKHAVEFQAEHAVEGDVLVLHRGFPASDTFRCNLTSLLPQVD